MRPGRVEAPEGMPALLDTVMFVVRAVRPERTACLSCRGPVSSGDETVRLRGGGVVHRRCATYVMRRRRTGGERLGYPRR